MKKFYRWIAICLAFALIVNTLPVMQAFAEETTDNTGTTTTEGTPSASGDEITVSDAPVITLVSSTKNTLSIKWNDVEDAQEYELYSYNGATGSMTLLTTTSSTSYEYTGLKTATPVSFCICSVYVNEDGTTRKGTMSEHYTFTTKPDKATGLTVTGQTDTTISLSWDATPGATSYVVYHYLSQYGYYEEVGETIETTYTMTGLTPSTAYRLKVAAKTSEAGTKSDYIKTCTTPSQINISYVKSGEKKAKICWNKVPGTTGYIVYQKDAAGTYTEIGQNTGAASTTFVVENLENGLDYTFAVMGYKTYNEVTYYGVQSFDSTVTVAGVQPTSVKALLFSTWKKFKNSDTYKKFKQFKKNIIKAQSFPIPGLITTNVAGFNANNMCPQAVCATEEYFLITAYDYEGIENSVIYVLDVKTKEYITTIVLSNKSHVGGIACDGKNVWISNGKKVNVISYQSVVDADDSGLDYVEVPYVTNCAVLTSSSFMTYYDNMLWVGEYNESASRDVYGYTISGEGSSLSLTKAVRMTVPAKTQGMVFDGKGRLILSRSCQVGDWLSVYLSVLEVYEPKAADSSGNISIDKVKASKTMPPMSEGLTIRGNYLYVNFESGAFSSCKYRTDRIIAYKWKKFK